MTEQREKIYEALCALCDACDLEGDSGTEDLFLIIAEAFSERNVSEMDLSREQSHAEGCMLNMIGLMSRKIENSLDSMFKKV